jgi:Mg-chelatase subunit ChlD
MKLLNRHTVPVWMLADNLMIVGVLGGLFALTALVPRPSTSQLEAHNRHQSDKLATLVRASQEKDSQHLLEISQLKSELKGLENRVASLSKYEKDASEWINWAKGKIDEQKQENQREKGLRQQLLNLKGDFTRVVFVIDTSGSMGAKPAKEMPRANWGDGGEPWTHVRTQVSTWIKHLPVESFRVVCFNHQVTEFPNDNQPWLKGEEGRRQATKFLSQIKPDGGTNTELALKHSLALKPTAIILFTDGVPTKEVKDGFAYDSAQVERIVELVQKSPAKAPINVVAVNHYFDEQFGSFLHKLASYSGGGFIGL